jgi:hypothetical protein
MAKKRWVLLERSTTPSAGDIGRIAPNPPKPVRKQERQRQLRGELEREVIAKRKAQLSTADERMGHLIAGGDSVAKADLVFVQPDGSESPRGSDGAVHQWGDEEFEKSSCAGHGMSTFWRESPSESEAPSPAPDGYGRITPTRRSRRKR